MVKIIPLTQGEFAFIDEEDFKYLNQWKWTTHNGNGYSKYACRSEYQNKKRVLILMHRFILNPKKGLFVDHINGDGLDNRRCNLRIVTHRQNLQNNTRKKSSKYPGVCYIKNGNKWGAYIKIGDQKKFLGYYKHEKNAFKAYKKAVHDLGEKLVCELENDNPKELKMAFDFGDLYKKSLSSFDEQSGDAV